MNPYTHYLMASRLESTFQPEQPGEYYLGSIIPDIRYLVKIPRQHTHLSQAQIREYRSRYPHLDSFLMGYQVHCLLDEIDLSRVLGSTFVFKVISRVSGKKLSQQQLAILAELRFIQVPSIGWRIHETHNEVLSDLGIQPAQTAAFLDAMKEYLPSPSFETAISSFQKIGYVESSRFEKYFKAYQSLERNKPLKAILLWSVRRAKLDRYSEAYVQRRVKEEKALAERD